MLNEIICGDSLHLLKTLDDNYLDLTFTSPPYLNVKDYSQYDDVDDYINQMKEIFTLVFDKTKESRMCVVNISPILVARESRQKQSYRIPLPFYFVSMMEEIGFEFLEDIIWKKPDGSVINRNGSFYQHRKPLAYKPNVVTEYILVFKKPSKRLLDYFLKNESLVEDGYERTNVWEIHPETKSKHPAPYPLELAEKVIKYYSYENDLVFDPFIGSGTTAVAAKKLGRNYLGFELYQEYVDMTNERINKM
tara:strand:+ start:110 stop:856 length:747 start_codon:yes stop_codon:yes gene_type:complete